MENSRCKLYNKKMHYMVCSTIFFLLVVSIVASSPVSFSLENRGSGSKVGSYSDGYELGEINGRDN